MVSSPLIRVVPALLALAVAGAVLPVASASATPDPTTTTAVAARACAAAMQQYPLDDDVDVALQVRLEAWREAAGGTVTGMTEETSWVASLSQVASLQVALTWMSAASVRELKTLDEDDLRSAEDDLVWAVDSLPDRRLAKVLVRPLADRTAAIARLRDRAAQSLSDDSSATPTPTPTPTATGDAESRPDVTAGALVRFQRRLHTAMRSVSPYVRDDLQDLRSAGSVHGLGAISSLLEWTQQQGERGQELFNSWDGAGAVYAAALRSVVAGTASATTYPGVLDACVRTLRAGSDDEGLTVKQARSLARTDIALHLDPYGVVRPISESTSKVKAPAKSTSKVKSPAKSTSKVKVPAKATPKVKVPAKATPKVKVPAKATPKVKVPAKSTTSAPTCPGVTTAKSKSKTAAFCSATD